MRDPFIWIPIISKNLGIRISMVEQQERSILFVGPNKGPCKTSFMWMVNAQLLMDSRIKLFGTFSLVRC